MKKTIPKKKKLYHIGLCKEQLNSAKIALEILLIKLLGTAQEKTRTSYFNREYCSYLSFKAFFFFIVFFIFFSFDCYEKN